MKQSISKRLLGILLLLGCLWGNLGFALWQPMTVSLEPVQWSPGVEWIAPAQPSHRFYARHTFYGPETVRAAWVRISADSDFVFNINGRQSVIRENGALNSPKGLAYRRKVPLQNFSDTLPYAARTGLNYVMANSPDWKISVYLDLTHYVHAGKNVIAIEVAKGEPDARLVVEGEVTSASELDTLDLSTGKTPWKAATLAENHSALRWLHPEFDDTHWADAVALGPIREPTYSRLSQHLFDRPVQGEWITAAADETWPHTTWLHTTWQVPSGTGRSLLRYAAKGQPAVFINGQLVDTQAATQGEQLRMFDVTAYVRPGANSVAVHLNSPLDPAWAQERGSEPLSLFLDGWTETRQGKVLAPIQTDGRWQGALQPPWRSQAPGQSAEDAKPVVLLRQAASQEFMHRFLGHPFLNRTGWYIGHQGLWWVLGCGVSMSLAWGLGRGWFRQREHALKAGTDALLPTLLFLMGVTLLKHRHAEGAWAIWFEQAGCDRTLLLGSLLVLLLTLLTLERTHGRWWRYGGLLGASALGLGLLFSQSIAPGLIFAVLAGVLVTVRWQLLSCLDTWSGRCLAYLETPSKSSQRWRLVGLGLILGLGFCLRVYRLTKEDLDSDENTSYDATRGILRTGIPIATSGIWYTRGPVFHYLLALWLRLVGDSVFNARFFSVVFGTATLLLMYYITQKVTGRVWIALVVMLILAINPWELWYSRFIRFYQMVQFTTLLAVWAFVRGFIDDAGRRYQYVFFGALTGTLLIQEVSLTITPGFLMGYLCFARRFRWRYDWRLWLSALMLITIFAYDIFFFKIKCLTPWTALSASTASYLKPHLLDVTGFFACFFIGPNRLEILYTAFFLAGFIYCLRQQKGLALFLFSFVLINLLVLTLLTFQIAERYAYSVYPLFIMLAVYSAIALTQSLVQALQQGPFNAWPVRAIATVCLVLLLVSNLELGRIAHSYSQAIGRRNTEIFEYIRDHRQPGDVVISPTPSFGPVTIGPVDYFLMGTWYFDATYWRDGRLLDRWGGGVIVTNLDQLENILETSQRVWIHVDDARQSRLSAQMLEYIQTVGKPVYDTFGTSLRLWDAADGWIPHTPEQGKGLGGY